MILLTLCDKKKTSGVMSTLTHSRHVTIIKVVQFTMMILMTRLKLLNELYSCAAVSSLPRTLTIQ